MNGFKLEKDGQARAGELLTPHGAVATPVFMPVGSQAAVKALTPDDVRGCGYRMLLANTYHLYLRPGADVVEKLGGVHRFMGWPGAVLTDSGGYQVFSLSSLSRVTEEGVAFRSHIDGSSRFISPELAVGLQRQLGADVVMVLDEPSPVGAEPGAVRMAMERTHRWAARCKEALTGGQQLFAIVQGGLSAEMRRESAETLAGMDFPGYAIGGLSLGEPKEVMWQIVELVAGMLPPGRPRYLMGVGSPEDFVRAVGLGMDMMDCALPTRVARNGALFTAGGRINITNSGFRLLDGPVEAGCDCYTCRSFSAAYLHHLFRAGELLAYRLATIHNLRFMARLMEASRQAILSGRFDAFADGFLARYRTTDEEVRLSQKRKWLDARR